MKLPSPDTKATLSAHMKALRARVKPENCVRELSDLRRAQKASVASKRAAKKNLK